MIEFVHLREQAGELQPRLGMQLAQPKEPL